MRMVAILKNDDHPEYGEVSMPLPIKASEYQKTEQSPVQQESVGCHTPSAYDLLDILFVVQNQMEAIHKTQQEEFSSNKTLENSFQVVSGHLETLLDSMSMWIADVEDLAQAPPQEHENEELTGMQMG